MCLWQRPWQTQAYRQQLLLQASERIPISVCGIHCTVTILAWVGVATAKGDYRYKPPSFLFGAQQKAMLLACLSGALTWVWLNAPTMQCEWSCHHAGTSSVPILL